jgi:hypothetical protein
VFEVFSQNCAGEKAAGISDITILFKLDEPSLLQVLQGVLHDLQLYSQVMDEFLNR